MAGPQDIQRFPQGLLNVLNMQAGGETPRVLSETVVGTMELLQFYGLTQRQVLTRGAAAQVVGTPMLLSAGTFPLPVSSWCVLFAATASIVNAAAMTAAELSIQVRRGGSGFVSLTFERYTAADVGFASGSNGLAFETHYPLLLPPGSDVGALLTNLQGVANATLSLTVEVGVLG